MMGKRLTSAEVRQRLADAADHEYDPDIMGQLWGMDGKSAAEWMREHCHEKYSKTLRARRKKETPPKYRIVREKPEYENQRLFDIQVMTREQWCKTWGIPLVEYKTFLHMYEKQCGEKLATPERRAKWEEEYCSKM